MYPTMVSVAIMKQESSDSSVRVYGSQLKWRYAVWGSIGQKILKTDHMNLTSINMSFTDKELTKYYGHERTSTSHLILQNESTDRNWIGLQSDWNGNKLKKGAQAYFCVDEVSNCQEFKPTPVFSHRRTWRSQPIQIRPDFDSKRLSIYISPNYRREPLNLPVPKIFESWWDQGKWTGQIFMKQWNFFCPIVRN